MKIDSEYPFHNPPLMYLCDAELERGGGGGGGGGGKPVLVLNFNEFFEERRFPDVDASTYLKPIGIFVGHATHPVVRDELLPKYGYFSERSAEHIDFMCVGFNRDGKVKDGDFVALVEAFERATEWRYSGVTELILLNAYYVKDSKKAELDFTSAVVLPIEKMVKDTSVSGVSEIVEDLIRFAKQRNHVDPSWNYSDKKGRDALRDSFFNLVVSALPTDLRGKAKEVAYFAVKDLS